MENNFKILDHWFNAYNSNVIFKVIKNNVVYLLEVFCENFNLISLKSQVMDFEGLTVEEFKNKYNYIVYSL